MPRGQPVGLVWVALDRTRQGEAWIYDIEINAEHQGKGYGRALLQAAEQETAESSGYQITSVNMHKELGTGRPKSNSQVTR